MIGICALIIIHPVTGITGCRGTFKTIGMTTEAIYSIVSSGQGECSGIVIKSTISLTCRMAGQARRIRIRIPGYARMLLICFGIGMTRNAGIFLKVGRIGMTIYTLIPFTFV